VIELKISQASDSTYQFRLAELSPPKIATGDNLAITEAPFRGRITITEATSRPLEFAFYSLLSMQAI
jgi:hypothetical protein